MTNSAQHQSEILQERYGRQVAARLSDSAAGLPHDITERLRAARAQAVSRRKIARTRTASAVSGSGRSATLTFGDEGLSWWSRVASVLPLVVLVTGLVAINVIQNDNRASELAEVDAALLTDDLPPAAYADPGFAQFLKSAAERPQ